MVLSNNKLRIFFRKKKINKNVFFLSKSMPNFNFAKIMQVENREGFR